MEKKSTIKSWADEMEDEANDEKKEPEKEIDRYDYTKRKTSSDMREERHGRGNLDDSFPQDQLSSYERDFPPPDQKSENKSQDYRIVREDFDRDARSRREYRDERRNYDRGDYSYRREMPPSSRDYSRDSGHSFSRNSQRDFPKRTYGDRHARDRPRKFEEFDENDNSDWKHDRYESGRRDRRPPKENQRIIQDISEKHEFGQVCSVKDSYGFIKCLERDEDVFFHFSEIPRDQESNISNGTCVEFQVTTDPRSGKLSATNIKILPKGTVTFKVISETCYRGTIIVGLNIQSSENGLIEYEVDGQKEEIQFSSSDVDQPKTDLQLEDEVEFNILTDVKKKTKIATHVTIYKLGGYRETGVVTSIKAGFGFIMCSETPDSLYFHFSDVLYFDKDQQQIQKGDEVEFNVSLDKRINKPIATRIRILPKGTISWNETLPDRYRGIVEAEIVWKDKLSFQKKIENFGSILLVNDQENLKESIKFGPDSIRDIRTNLRLNDEVEFTIEVSKRTKEKRAKDILLVKRTEIRETGIIHSIKKNFGYITSAERDEDIFFHFSDLPRDVEVYEGDEIEFTVVNDRNQKKKAIDFKILEKGTVKFENIFEEVHKGVIVKECNSYKRGRDIHGLLLSQIEVDGKKREFAFTSDGILDQNKRLWQKDEVEFNICEEKKTKIQSAVNIRLVKEADLPREKGIITRLSKNTGTILVANAASVINFDSSYEDKSLKSGNCVEFSIVRPSWSDKEIAIRLSLLPEGSIQIPENIKYQGRIDRELRGRGYHSESPTGRILYYPDKNSSTEKFIEFGPDDFDKTFSFRKGDPVEFRIAFDSKEPRATDIVATREKGFVIGAKSNYGFISVPGRKDEVYYEEKEVEKGTILEDGDEVEFSVLFQKKRLNAIDIKRIRKAAEVDLSKKPVFGKTEKSPFFLLRQPIGPESSEKGFKSGNGRGKVIPEKEKSIAFHKSSSQGSLNDSSQKNRKKESFDEI